MAKRRITFDDIYNMKFEELKRLVPTEAHPYLERLRPNLKAIDEKYAALYAQAAANSQPDTSIKDSSFIKVQGSYPIKDQLDAYVIGQHNAKKVLAQVSYYHMSHLKRELDTGRINEDYIKSSILMIGPTGSGKTLLANTLSRILKVPFVKVDATSMTKTGFVGDSIQDAVRELYYTTGGDLKRAESGVILVDEIDKLAGGSREDYVANSIVIGRGVQQELLRPMENSMIDIFSQNNIHSIREMLQGGDLENKKISTRNILFILAGAFDGLEEVILKRKRKEQGQSIGFGSQTVLTAHDISLEETLPQDLIEYGLIPELVGRISYIVPLEKLDQQKLYEVLKDSKGSISQQIEENIFKTTDKRVTFTDEALKTVAKEASKVQTGGRALTEICFRIMNEFMFHLPSLELESYEITSDFVYHYLPKTYELIVAPHIEQSLKKFPFIADKLEWDRSAKDYIIQQMVERKISSIHKYVSDFMSSWAPIIGRINTEQQRTLVITGSILSDYDQHTDAANEQLYQLLSERHESPQETPF
ncbi:AAA family ATPase [Deltaproteobacteria bacterium TL4]